MQAHFEGIWVPIVTPFRGEVVDHAALSRLAQHLRDNGIRGLVAGATTGEGALLRSGEQEAIFATLRDAVPGMPIVLGVFEAATHQAAALARDLASLGPEGLLVTPPTYVRPSQEGVKRHFETIVDAADIPVLIYNIPYRTGVAVELETLQTLAVDARVVGIKECGGTMERMLRLVHETPLRVFAGDDNQSFAALCLGAHGAILASAHVQPQWHVLIRDLLRHGKLDAARRIAVALQPMISDLFAEPNPSPLKAWLAQQLRCEASVRLPFVPASDSLCNRLHSDWSALQRFEVEVQ